MATLTAHLISETHSERVRLTRLFADLAPEQWSAQSLCEGWRVLDVLAHMTMPFRTTTIEVITGVVRARFSFNRFADRDARAAARAMSPAELLGLLRRNVGHPWTPPGGGQIGALSHDVIHGLDITEPLGLPAAPPERLALVLASTSARQLKYFGVDLDGVTLTATDADVCVGEGPTFVQLTAAEILLAVTGRRPLNQAPEARH